MDGPCTFDQMRGCLRDIAQVNRLTLAYRPTLQWLDHIAQVLPPPRTPLHLVDVGCGYGDMLRRIHAWAQARNLPVRLTGIDLNEDAIRAAREATLPGTVDYLAGNCFDFKPVSGIDLVISSLMTHHLEDAAIVEFLAWMESVARLGWFVNDLHRQPLPYHLFRLLCRFTRWHPFVKHDGPVSILRSFRPKDWDVLTQAARIPEGAAQVQEYSPARLCVARRH
jgi:SAM-dependent methyltransferase